MTPIYVAASLAIVGLLCAAGACGHRRRPRASGPVRVLLTGVFGVRREEYDAVGWRLVQAQRAVLIAVWLLLGYWFFR